MAAGARHSQYGFRRRVNFYEVDSAGIVHFSWYFRYMEEAEHALWRAAGLSIARPGAAVGFPRVNAAFDYHKPLRFEDEFDIVIRITAMGAKSMRYECLLSRDAARIAVGTATIVCVTRDAAGTMTSAPIPPDIADRFEVATGLHA